MSEIRTCEEYVLHELEVKDKVIDELEEKVNNLQAQLDRYTNHDRLGSDHDIIEQRLTEHCLDIGRHQFVKDCMSFFTVPPIDFEGKEMSFDTWCWKNINQAEIPSDIVNTTQFIVYMRKELASMYEDALNECKSKQSE